MSSKNVKGQVLLLLLLLGVGTAVPGFAGSAVIGSVAGSMNATLGGQVLLPHTTIVSGDTVEVNEGAAVVAVDDTSRMVFGRQTTASFLRDANEITVLLSHGNLSMYHPQDGTPLRVKVGELTVVPAKGFKTLGEVAMLGSSVVITAKEGSLRVEGRGSALEVAKGKTITIPARAARAATPGSAKPAAGAIAGIGWQVASVAAGGTAAALSGVAISRANGAKDAANAATAAGNAATAAANAATTAATTADTDAIAATAAANAATAAATAGATANAAAINTVGCALDVVNPNVTVNGKKVSPYIPPAGSTC